MSLRYVIEGNYYDCYYDESILCFIGGHSNIFTVTKDWNTHNLSSAMRVLNGRKVCVDLNMLRVITSLVLL